MIADRHGAKVFRTVDELLPHVDVVSVAVPTSAHHQVARACLQAGKHVLNSGLTLHAGHGLTYRNVKPVAAIPHMGELNIGVALAIASVKATLVALYFMHLRWGARFHLVVLGGAVAFAVLLAAFVVFDSTEYQPDIRAATEAAAKQPAPAR